LGSSEVVRGRDSCYTGRVNPRIVLALIFSAIFPCYSGILAVSRASESIPESGISAKSLGRLLEEHYRHPRTLRAIFFERYSEGQKQARFESGTVYFKRPGRMRWEYESPEKKLFLADGKTVWFYVPYDHTVTKAPAKESSDWRTPLALLTGKVELSRLCSREDLIEQKGIPASHAILRCLPKGEKRPPPDALAKSSQPAAGPPDEADFTEVLLELNKSSGELARIEIRRPGGVELEYRFGDWQEDIPLADDMFRFQVPGGVAVVDGAALSEGPR
jgi:outer membrane lipoprotein carrier protein